MPFELFRKKQRQDGVVFFRGTLAPRLDELELERLGIRTEVRQVPNAHWAANLTHGQWGNACLFAFRDSPLPPAELVDNDARLEESEKELVKQAGFPLHVAMEASKSYVLADRKLLLRFMSAILGKDGLISLDRISQRFWTRDALDDELAHDADLDIEALLTFHLVGGWLHSHGLAEIGSNDFDILNPSQDVQSLQLFDLQRALAFHILEGKHDGANLVLARPGGEVRLVPVQEFNRKAASKWTAMRDMDDDSHNQRRFVVCEPVRGFFARWSKQIHPSRFLSNPTPESMVICFPDEATRLMAERAQKSYPLFRSIAEQFADLELPLLVKLGYPTDSPPADAREHLWFSVHECKEGCVDATLENEPFDIATMHKGMRGEHGIERLTDWTIPSPAGWITPRDLAPLRILREHKAELLEAMRDRVST